MQAMLYEFLRRGRLDANLEHARSILHERRDALVAALEQHLGPRGASWSHPDGGYFVWLDFPEGVAADDVFDRAAEAGVAVVKGSDFFPRASGGQSSLRHAHTRQDEFVYILEGSPTLHTDEGSVRLAPGMCAGFNAGTGNGHHLGNETAADVIYLEIGDRLPGDEASYPDDDLRAALADGKWRFVHKDGTPYA